MFKVPNKFRVRFGPLASDPSIGNNGHFMVPAGKCKAVCIASDGAGWEHVSVHMVEMGKSRIPSWEEMCRVKSWFWESEDCVVQYHPPQSDYVNFNPHVLHLWRKIGEEMPRPPKILVGGGA